MTGRSSHLDIVGQATGWVAAAAAVEARASDVVPLFATATTRHVIVAGCGSPYFLAESAAAIWQRELGHAIVAAHPASDVVERAADLVRWPDATTLVAISRSGSTTELLEAIGAFRRAGGRRVLAITCRATSPLAASADVAVAFDDGFESSVAQTRSFASMLVAVEAIAAVLGDRAITTPAVLTASCEAALERGASMVAGLTGLADARRIDFLGSGAHYGIAREAMLKMTEMALTSSAAYPFLEYRHGPMSMVDERAIVVGLVGGSNPAVEADVLADMAGLGGVIRRVDVDGNTLASLLPPLQLLAHARATACALDPDHPRHLTAVVHLDGELRTDRSTRPTPTNPLDPVTPRGT